MASCACVTRIVELGMQTQPITGEVAALPALWYILSKIFPDVSTCTCKKQFSKILSCRRATAYFSFLVKIRVFLVTMGHEDPEECDIDWNTRNDKHLDPAELCGLNHSPFSATVYFVNCLTIRDQQSAWAGTFIDHVLCPRFLKLGNEISKRTFPVELSFRTKS